MYDRGMFKKLVAENSNHIGIQFVRYGVVALVAFAIDFGLLYVFTRYAHIFYLVSATLSFSISLVVNYLLSIAWVFSRRADMSRSREMSGFALIGVIGLGLNLIVIGFLTSVTGIYYLDSKLIATVVVFFWSFVARRYLIFRPEIT